VRHLTIKTVPAAATAKANLIDVPLIDGENLACARPAIPVDETATLSHQHRAGEEQVAAGTALPAVTTTDEKLLLNKTFSEMDHPKASDLSGDVQEKPEIGCRAGNLDHPIMGNRNQAGNMIGTTVDASVNQLHMNLFSGGLSSNRTRIYRILKPHGRSVELQMIVWPTPGHPDPPVDVIRYPDAEVTAPAAS